jgi:glycosyltransferase involved in cell wall biosynthesis
MRVLFVHRAFPDQFGRLALELTKRYGWECTFLVEHLSTCPPASPEMLARLKIVAVKRAGGQTAPKESPPWPQRYGDALERGRAVFDVARSLSGFRPDLVVGHGGLLPTFLLRELFDCPFVDFAEYYFAKARSDLTYRLDVGSPDLVPFYPRCINAATLVNLLACDAAYAPTEWQRRSFPSRFWPKIEVQTDGVDAELYRPRPVPGSVAGREISPEMRVVTFAARGLESMRGFDLFLRMGRLMLRQRSDLLFLVAGSDESYYGWDSAATGMRSFKEWLLKQGDYDLGRFDFLGQLEPEQLAAFFCRSDLHVYLTVPFVLSWSLLNALSCGCLVLAADVPPVREVILPGHNGLISPFFDVERLAENALQVLTCPETFRPLRKAARQTIEDKYSLDRTVPSLKEFLERVRNSPRRRE